MRFAHTDVEIAKRIDKQACLTVFPSPHPFIACAIPVPPGLMSEIESPIAPSNGSSHCPKTAPLDSGAA